jgi:chitinase
MDAVDFDAVYVQFYNNYCGLQAFSNPNDWNFGTWDNWAKTTSPNKDVKIYIGAPASSTASGSGYVDADTFANIIKETKSQYSSFGGVMMWDMSQAYANDRYDVAAKNAMGGASAPAPPPTSSSSSSSSSSRSTSSTSSKPSSVPTAGGSCSGVPAWTTGVAYVGGSQVTYNNHLWVSKWWSESDEPGGSAGDWTDEGPCSSVEGGKPLASALLITDASESLAATHPLEANDVITPVSDATQTADTGSETHGHVHEVRHLRWERY